MIINEIKALAVRNLSDKLQKELDNMTAPQVKTLFNQLPDSAWLKIGQCIAMGSSDDLGQFLINTAKTYFMNQAKTQVDTLFVNDPLSQSQLSTLVD